MPNKEPEMSVLPAIRRQMIWDVSEHDIVEQVCDMAGLTATSPDVAELEHRDSHTRTAMLSPFSPVIKTLTEEMASIHADVYMKQLAAMGEKTDEETHELMRQRYIHLIGTSYTAMLAQMMGSELLTYGRAMYV